MSHYWSKMRLSCFFDCFVLQIGSHIRKQVADLGNSCTGLVSKAGALQCSPNDSYTKKELIDSARKVSEKVRSSFLLLDILYGCHFSLHQTHDDFSLSLRCLTCWRLFRRAIVALRPALLLPVLFLASSLIWTPLSCLPPQALSTERTPRPLQTTGTPSAKMTAPKLPRWTSQWPILSPLAHIKHLALLCIKLQEHNWLQISPDAREVLLKNQNHTVPNDSSPYW